MKLSQTHLAMTGLSALLALTSGAANAALPVDCQPYSRGTVIDQFHSAEATMLRFERAMSGVPYGSVKYNEFSRIRNEQAALATRSVQIGLDQYGHEEISVFLDEVEGKMGGVSYGSVSYNMYSSARTSAVTAYQAKGIENLNCATMTYDYALDGATEYEALMGRVSYGSAKYNAYSALRTEAYRVATLRLNEYLAYTDLDFRSVDTLAESFEDMMGRTSYGSLAYNFYSSGRTTALNRSLDLARSQVLAMDLATLGSIVGEYEACVSRSSYGSARYNFCVSVRDVIRAEITRKTPPPRPAPGYCPDPSTVWDARLGRCVSRATPPPPRPIPHPHPVPAPRPGPGSPGYCPDPATHWDARLRRCVR